MTLVLIFIVVFKLSIELSISNWLFVVVAFGGISIVQE